MNTLDKTLLIENLFANDDEFSSDEFNSLVISKISVHPGWYLSNDEQRQNQKVDDVYSDTGMLLESYYDKEYNKSKSHQEINLMANLIFQKIILYMPFEFKDVTLVRYLWNYYNRSSTGVPHKDISDETPGNFCSIVYHLNDSDGYTIVDDDEFLSKSGQCVIFDSKKLHRGTGPKSSTKRYCLNIVFRYDSIIGLEDE